MHFEFYKHLTTLSVAAAVAVVAVYREFVIESAYLGIALIAFGVCAITSLFGMLEAVVGLPRLHGQFALGYSTSSQSNVLVFSGAKVAQGGVSSPGVVKALDVFEDRCSQHLSVRP